MFKNWSWKQWTALGIIAAVIITAFIFHMIQPEVKYAWLEVVAFAMFILGGITGYFLTKNHVVTDNKKSEKNLLLD